MAVSNRVPILTMALCAGFLVYPLQAQISVPDLQALEAPWECRNPIGVAGVFVTADTILTQESGQQDITSQSIDIRVYQRQGEQEYGGYFSPRTGPDGSTVFDGKRLIIHFKDRADIPPFDLDVRFDRTAGHWAGSWVALRQIARGRSGAPSSGRRSPPKRVRGRLGGIPRSNSKVSRRGWYSAYQAGS
jgi:hypothetical protein